VTDGPVWSRISAIDLQMPSATTPEAQRPLYEEGYSKAFTLLTAILWEFNYVLLITLFYADLARTVDELEALWGTKGSS